MAGRIGLIGANGSTGGSSGRGKIGLIAPTGGGAEEGAGTSDSGHHGGGGLLGAIGHVLAQGGEDIYNAAVQTPAALVQLHEALAAADPSNLRHVGHSNTKPLQQLGVAYGKQLKQDVTHPLRHPGNTLLDLLPVGSAVARAGLAGATAARLAEAGDLTGAAKALAKKPDLGPRELRQGDTTLAKGHYSRSAGSALIQKAVDTALEKGAGKSSRVENVLHRRAAKFNERTLRVQEAKARSAGTKLAAAGKTLTPAEQRALRLVAEEVPAGRRLAAQELRKGGAKSAKETARHQERIDVTKGAMEFLDEGPNGRPVFKPSATKLRDVYRLLQKVSADRESMLRNLDLMDEARSQGAKTKAARVAAGASFVKDTLGERFAATPERFRPQFVENLVGRYVKAADRQNFGRILSIDPEHQTARLYFKSKEGARSTVDLPLDQLTNPRGKAGKVKGAEDIAVSAEAPFIGSPAERGRITGRPKVSSTGTFGHTPKPSSLKTATGGAVEHALERNDTTGIVAERHAEAVRLSQIQRRVEMAKSSGTAVPRRKDDVFVWTDKTASQERIPAEVRKFLDNPDQLARMPRPEQESVLDQLKAAVMERHDWQADPESRAEFEKLAEQGKGVFVPRRLLGNAAKPSPNIGAVPGIRAVDAINNAQKAALVYLKVNYPIVQGFSNAAMGLIQQGFAYPIHLTQAARLSKRIGAGHAAVVDDIMGQGAVVQAALTGEGRIAHLSQNLAHVMSTAVDTPARRAAFLYEADKAGFGTPAKLKALLDDDGNLDKLVEVSQRAKEAIVDYGELSPTERSLIRRLVFVYPWQKGATKYAAHFVRDHPAQAAALGLTGQQGATIKQQTLGAVPSYLDGVFDVGGKLVNPSGVNFFQTPAQIGRAAAAFASGNPAASSGQDFLAPAPALAVSLLTRRDDLGRPLKGNVLSKAKQTLVDQTPAAQLVAALTGHAAPSKTYPNPNDAFWRFLFGGLYPREYSRPALNSNAAREKTGD